MTKVLYLDYIALIIYALIILTLLIRTHLERKIRGLFAFLIGVALLATIYDVCAVLMDNHGSGGVILKYVLHCGYLVLRNLISPVLGAYAIAITDTWHGLVKTKTVRFLVALPFAAAAILTLSSPYTHLVFYLNENDAYTRGPLFFVLYISALFYMVFSVAYIIKYYRVLKIGGRFVPLFSIAPAQLIAVLIQFLYPDVLCEMFCTSMSLLLIMLTVERPDGKTDQTLGVLKSSAFSDMFIQGQLVNKPFTVILVNITNHSAITSYISTNHVNGLFSGIIERTKVVTEHLNLTSEIYNLEQGLFASVLYKVDEDKVREYAKALTVSLNNDYTVSDYTVSALVNVSVVNIPDDISTIDAFRIIVKEFRRSNYVGEYTLASSVINSKDYSVITNMDSILRKAIENRQFEVYYQPIYSTEEKRFNSAEALIRLKTEEYGFIRPDLFIPAAEDSELIHEIGMMVFESVCQFIASDDFKKTGLDYIEVNLSVVQCMDKDLAFKIFAMMDKYRIHPSRLNLEITETASSFIQSNMTANIERLHSEGLSFSLDDFGTGYSNMVRIASLPLHIVKLDKSFTWTENNNDLKIILVNSINMLKKMNMKIVVEGIETKEMLNTFTELGCDYIQGYYFSKPVPKDEFVDFIVNYK